MSNRDPYSDFRYKCCYSALSFHKPTFACIKRSAHFPASRPDVLSATILPSAV